MALRAVFNHLVLPPRVPGEPDANEAQVSSDVLARMTNSCFTASTRAQPAWSVAFGTLRASLDASDVLHRSDGLSRAALLAHFRKLETGRMLMLHLEPQNAALLFWAEKNR